MQSGDTYDCKHLVFSTLQSINFTQKKTLTKLSQKLSFLYLSKPETFSEINRNRLFKFIYSLQYYQYHNPCHVFMCITMLVYINDAIFFDLCIHFFEVSIRSHVHFYNYTKNLPNSPSNFKVIIDARLQSFDSTVW